MQVQCHPFQVRIALQIQRLQRLSGGRNTPHDTLSCMHMTKCPHEYGTVMRSGHVRCGPMQVRSLETALACGLQAGRPDGARHARTHRSRPPSHGPRRGTRRPAGTVSGVARARLNNGREKRVSLVRWMTREGRVRHASRQQGDAHDLCARAHVTPCYVQGTHAPRADVSRSQTPQPRGARRIRPSRAMTPSPGARTFTGLRSSSWISGTLSTRAETRSTSAMSASRSPGGAPR